MPERTFTFIDLAGFTAATEAHGDEAAVHLATRLMEVTDSLLGADDALVKSLGDAVLVASGQPTDALELIDRLASALSEEIDFPVIRVGLHHGSAIERDGDWFGAGVNLAARVAALAGACQVLATEPVAIEARIAGLRVTDLGGHWLRNVTDEVTVFEVAVPSMAHGDAIDPVCQMRVSVDAAAGRLRHEGVEHLFCSLKCVAAFAADPSAYLR